LNRAIAALWRAAIPPCGRAGFPAQPHRISVLISAANGQRKNATAVRQLHVQHRRDLAQEIANFHFAQIVAVTDPLFNVGDLRAINSESLKGDRHTHGSFLDVFKRLKSASSFGDLLFMRFWLPTD
jgi:hypothetical protein